jgi:hypothetical protein
MEIELESIEFSSLEEVLHLPFDSPLFELSIEFVHLVNLITRRYDDSLTSISILPYGHRCSPVARTRDAPVWCRLDPLRESSIFEVLWKPIDLIIGSEELFFL